MSLDYFYIMFFPSALAICIERECGNRCDIDALFDHTNYV